MNKLEAHIANGLTKWGSKKVRILKLLCEGFSNKEVSSILHIQYSDVTTVKSTYKELITSYRLKVSEEL